MMIIVLVMLVLFAPLTESFMFVDTLLAEGLGRERGVPKTDWYEVADWEIEYCMNQGGTDEVIESGVGTMGTEKSFITLNRIITIQAEKNNIIN